MSGKAKDVDFLKNTVYIGRRVSYGMWNLQDSIWKNPFKIGPDGDREKVIEKYSKYIIGRPDLLEKLKDLKGKTLGCWCKKNGDEGCHGDILALLADNLSTDSSFSNSSPQELIYQASSILKIPPPQTPIKDSIKRQRTDIFETTRSVKKRLFK